VRGLIGASALAITLGIAQGAAEAQPLAPPPPSAPPSAAGPLGLTLPQPSPPTPEMIRTEQQLDQAKIDDAGRRLEWVWVDVHGGFEQLGMQTFNGGQRGFVAGLVNTSSSGGFVAAGVGARLLYFTFLLRGRVGVFDSGQLYRVGGEAGFHVPFGRIEPRLSLGTGYAGMNNLRDAASAGGGASTLALHGFYVRADAGVDYYLTPLFSLGVGLSADLLGLFRPALSMAEVQVIKANAAIPAGVRSGADVLTMSGAGWGGTLGVTALAGLHF